MTASGAVSICKYDRLAFRINFFFCQNLVPAREGLGAGLEVERKCRQNQVGGERALTQPFPCSLHRPPGPPCTLVPRVLCALMRSLPIQMLSGCLEEPGAVPARGTRGVQEETATECGTKPAERPWSVAGWLRRTGRQKGACGSPGSRKGRCKGTGVGASRVSWSCV